MSYKCIGKYVYTTKPIGKGSFSIIYKGQHQITKKKVAIKKIIRYIDNKYINSEIELMKNMNHKNILKLYEVISYKQNLYLILEYCNMGDLTNYIKQDNSNLDINFINQILNGLKYLYNKKIIHRDIKPNNILIHNNIIKIADFGFAKSFNDDDMIFIDCNTPYLNQLIDELTSPKQDYDNAGRVKVESKKDLLKQT